MFRRAARWTNSCQFDACASQLIVTVERFAVMELHGTLPENLRATLASMKRHHGHTVHRDTLDYWEQLFSHARDAVRKGRAGPEVTDLVRQIGIALADRQEAATSAK